MNYLSVRAHRERWVQGRIMADHGAPLNNNEVNEAEWCTERMMGGATEYCSKCVYGYKSGAGVFCLAVA